MIFTIYEGNEKKAFLLSTQGFLTWLCVIYGAYLAITQPANLFQFGMQLLANYIILGQGPSNKDG